MPREYAAVQGDCVENIAYAFGLYPDTVWDHPDNADLRESRDSVVLKPGDVVTIPDVRQETVDVAPDQRHRFRRRGVPSMFRVALDLGETPIEGLDYTLSIDNGAAFYRGKLDGTGRIEHPMPPDSRHAKLTVEEQVFEFDLGHLLPISERQGAVDRLRGLGYLEDSDGVSDDRLVAATTSFQREKGLDATGELTDATRAALVDAFGC